MPEDTGPRLRLTRRRLHARLRSRHPHRDAVERRTGPERPARRLRRPGPVHVPARRGGPPRRAVHARRGAARGPRPVRRHPVTGRRGVRIAHHLGAAERMGEQSTGRGHGVGRHDDDPHHRPRRSRQRAAPRTRSDPGGVRDRPGAADDDHPLDRRLRSVRRHRRTHLGGHHEQRDPRGRRDRGHDPGDEREHPRQGPRRHPPRRRRGRHGPRLRMRRPGRLRLPRDDQRRRLRRLRPRHGPRRRRPATRSCDCRTP